jgi:phosphoenolpyruvate carboxykinase (GTP)
VRLKIGATGKADKLPKLYYVNWFRKGADGKFLWPGFGENSRVLKWIFERVTGKADAKDTAIGRLPAPGALDHSGLDVPKAEMDKLLEVDVDGWTDQLPLIKEHYEKFGAHLPKGLKDELEALETRLKTGTPAGV